MIPKFVFVFEDILTNIQRLRERTQNHMLDYQLPCQLSFTLDTDVECVLFAML